MTPGQPTRLLALSTLSLLAACTGPPPADSGPPLPEGAPLPVTPFDAVTAVYLCGAAEDPVRLVIRTRADGLDVFLPPGHGEAHRVLATEVPGQRYAANGTTIELSEGSADLQLPGERFTGCRHDRQASIWEHAKLGGVDFRGVGNEPGWVLEIRRQSTLRFSYDYGSAELTVPIVAERSDPARASTTFEGRSEAGSLIVTLTGETCTDTMADAVYPTRVEVALGARSFRGCGRPLH